jgi:hypothetical protein
MAQTLDAFRFASDLQVHVHREGAKDAEETPGCLTVHHPGTEKFQCKISGLKRTVFAADAHRKPGTGGALQEHFQEEAVPTSVLLACA